MTKKLALLIVAVLVGILVLNIQTVSAGEPDIFISPIPNSECHPCRQAEVLPRIHLALIRDDSIVDEFRR